MKIFTKKYLSVITAAFILVCSAIIGVSYHNRNLDKIPELKIPMPDTELPNIDITNTASFNDLNNEAMVYKFKKINNTISDAENLANTLGLKGKISSNDASYFLNDNTVKFVFQKATGSWHVYLQDALNQKPGIVPSEEECKKIAIYYLKEKGLYNDRFTNITVTSSTGGGNTGATCNVIERLVYFYPEINGKPVYGVSRICVAIGNNGTVNSIFKTYKEIEEYKTLKLKSPGISFEDVKNKKAAINLSPLAKKAEVTKVKPAYWEDAGPTDEQPYLQPVWVFSGEATLDDGSKMDFDAIVPALIY